MNPLIPLASSVVILGLAAYFTRARLRRILIAAAGGVLFALGNVGWDVLADRMDWWRYPDGASPLWYVAAGLGFTGIGLIAWRVDRRYGTRGIVRLFILFALYGLARDFALSRFVSDAIEFGGGIVPWLVDFGAWLALTMFAVGVQMVIEPDTRSERLRG